MVEQNTTEVKPVLDNKSVLGATITDEEVVAHLERMFFKMQEITSMMKNGEFIVAYEKLGGVIKNISALRVHVLSKKK